MFQLDVQTVADVQIEIFHIIIAARVCASANRENLQNSSIWEWLMAKWSMDRM